MNSQRQIQIKFVGHEVQKGVVVYRIQLYDSKDSVQWVMQHRYSSMRDISKQLESENLGQLPDFPPKKWFGNMDEKFINQREKALENYFSNTLKAVNIDKVQSLKEFLFRNKNAAGSPIMAEDNSGPGRSQANSINIQPNPQNEKQPDSSQKGKNQATPAIKNNPQEQWKLKMEKIVSQVPFIDVLHFFGNQEEHNNIEKPNNYNKISFERKSKLLQNYSLPQCSTDFSQSAILAQHANVNLLNKLDVFAEKMHRALTTPLSNIYCDIVQNPNFA